MFVSKNKISGIITISIFCLISAFVFPQDLLAQTTLNATDYVSGGSGSSVDPWIGSTGRGGVGEALNALPPEGGTVYVPDGYYLISNAFVMPENSSIEGQSWNAVLKRDIISAYSIIISMGNNTSITNLTIDGDRYNQTVLMEGVRILGVENVLLGNVKFANIANPGVALYSNINNITIKDSTFENCYYGYLHDGLSNPISNLTNITVSGNYFTGDYNMAIIANIAEDTNNINYIGNILDPYKSMGIAIAETNNVTVKDNMLAGASQNAIASSYWPCIHVEGLSDNVQIINNDISNQRHWGISISEQPTNVVIKNNYIHDITTHGGISLQLNIDGVLIEENVIKDVNGIGVYLSSNIDNVEIYKNEITNISSDWAIRTSPDANTIDNIVVQANYINNVNDDSAVSLNNVTGIISVLENIITNANGDGVNINAIASPNIELINNAIAANAGAGFDIAGAGNVSALHNTVINNSGSGFVLNSSAGSIMYNIITGNGLYGVNSTGSTVGDNYNMIANNSSGAYSGSVSQGPGTVFVAPALRGGDYFSLAKNSSAIDSAIGSGTSQDISADPRPVDGLDDGSKISDIGADEYALYMLIPGNSGSVYITDDTNDNTGDTITNTALLKIGDEEQAGSPSEHRAVLSFDGSGIVDSEVNRAQLHVYLDSSQYDDLQHVKLLRIDGDDSPLISDASLFESNVIKDYGIIIPGGLQAGWYKVDVTDAFADDSNNRILFRLQFEDSNITPNGDDEDDCVAVRAKAYTDSRDSFAPYIEISLANVCPPNPINDFNNDCIVNWKDFINIAENWLECSNPNCN